MSLYDETLKVMETERECILRQDTPRCDRNCKTCDLCLPTYQVMNAFENVIKVLRELSTGRPMLYLNGQAIYLTQGHIDAFIEHERNEALKRYTDEIMKGMKDNG